MNQEKICLAVSVGLDRVVTVFWSLAEGDGDSGALEENKFLAEGEPGKYSSDKELLVAIEASYKSAWSLLSEELRLQENIAGIIFSVPQHWFSDGRVEEQKAALLKEVLDLLGGRFLGVVPEGELLLAVLKKQENELVNLVPISFGRELISVFPFIRGKMLGVQVVERSENIASDLEEALARFDFWQSFPPRILLLGSGSLEQARADLLSYPWVRSGKKAYFFHLPRVEVSPSRLLISGLINQAKEILSREKTSLSLPTSPGPSPYHDQESINETMPSQALGFVKNRDIASFETAEPDDLAGIREDKSLTRVGQEKEAGSKSIAGWRGLTTAVRKVRLDFWNRREPERSFRPKKVIPRRLVILLLFVILVLAGLIVGWWYLPKAEVVLVVAPKYSQGSASLLMALGVNEVKSEEGLAPAHQVTVTESDSGSAETTGEEMVGEKAEGKVMIYNRTEIEKTFEKGTVLSSTEGGLKFLLDEEITVEPASIEVDEHYNQTITPSKKEAVALAETIGADYNFSSGQEFSIASFIKDDFVARNEESFIGGSSHKAKVVAEEDRQNLKETVLESLTGKGAERITKQLSAGEKLINESLNFKVAEEKFSHEAGEETERLSLTLTADLTGLAYWDKDLNQLMEELVAREVPQGFVMGEEKQVDFEFIEEQEEGFLFDLNFSCSLYPDINEDEIKRKIAGRKTSVVEDYLYLLPSVNDFRIEVSSPLPNILLTLPCRPNNISIRMEPGK
jgi:hypothetical protein